jgi:hypothetical protein
MRLVFKLLGVGSLGILFGLAAQNWAALVMGTVMFWIVWDPAVAHIKKSLHIVRKPKPVPPSGHDYPG